MENNKNVKNHYGHKKRMTLKYELSAKYSLFTNPIFIKFYWMTLLFIKWWEELEIVFHDMVFLFLFLFFLIFHKPRFDPWKKNANRIAYNKASMIFSYGGKLWKKRKDSVHSVL